MSLGGWTTTDTPMRYGRAEKSARALAAYQRMGSPLDRASAKRWVPGRPTIARRVYDSAVFGGVVSPCAFAAAMSHPFSKVRGWKSRPDCTMRWSPTSYRRR